MTRLPSLALAAFAVAALGWVEAIGIGPAWAQVGTDQDLQVSDTLFVEKPREPISYSTSYDRNVSSATWTQTLDYTHSSNRVAMSADANLNTLQGLQGLQSDGNTGSIYGRLNVRATSRWIWALDGTFNMSSNRDKFATTDRRQNQIQIRTQYTANPWPELTGTGVLFSEFQEEQSLGLRTIPGLPLMVIDSTSVPRDTTLYRSHSARDSSYTTGRRDGFSGTLAWKPAAWLDTKGLLVATRIRPTTRTVRSEFWALDAGQGASLQQTTTERSRTPNGGQRYETSATYTGIRRTMMQIGLKDESSDQEYYALTRRGQEHVNYSGKSGNYHLENSPLTGAQITLDGTLGRSLREYRLQSNLNSLVNSSSLAGNFSLYRETTRASLGFLVTRTRNDRQVTQNGTVISRSLNAGGAKKLTRRLWLDGTGTISLFSRQYDDKVSDQDNVRGYVSGGGGYLVSQPCSTTVHFSVNRSHTVAIDPSASGSNNVNTTYQMDALMRLQVSTWFWIFQNYQINANYQIYDYDESRNTLTRIRRIDTTLSDSIFSFGFIRLTHNFYFQDRGSFSPDPADGVRKYNVAQTLYQQSLAASFGVSVFQGIVLSATQSLSNTRNYFPTPRQNAKSNRWNLNLGAVVDRELPGSMTLHGSIQHIGEFTEKPVFPIPKNVVDYWIAGVAFTKDF